MVAVVADGLYRDVLSQGYHGLPGAAFAPVDVQVKSYQGRAWIYLPGEVRSRGADRAQTPARSDADGGRPLVEEFLDSKDAW
jgi:hypothetical protein